jgi:class 3 adenylate cyclase
MEPQIRYVKSADGTTLATATLGSGPPLVFLSGTWTGTIESWWAIPDVRDWWEQLADRFKVVTFDLRGQGLSDRDVENFSLEARVADIEAVFSGLDLAEAYVAAGTFACPAVIEFASTNPTLVRRLVLIGPVASGRDWHFTPRSRAIQHLFDIDYELYWKCQSMVSLGWTDEGRLYASFAVKEVSADVMRRAFAQFRQHNAADALASIRCPTLVLGSRGEETAVPIEVTQRVAAAIPGARFRVSDSPGGIDWRMGSTHEDRTAIASFFEEDLPTTARREPLPQGMVVIVFADIADSTGLTERLGDAAFREQARTLDAALRDVIRESGGTPLDGRLVGDGLMATFTTASQALDAALRCLSASSELRLHLGLHAGDVLHERDNVFGGAVNIAARISALSEPGEILVSATVRDLARTSAGVTFEDRGERVLKGVTDALRVFAVRQEADAQERPRST